MRRIRCVVLGAAAFAGAVLLAGCTPAPSRPSSPAESVSTVGAPGAGATEVSEPDAIDSEAGQSAASASGSRVAAAPGSPARGTRALSDVSQLDRAGITLGDGTLIEVADDGDDRFLRAGDDGNVTFTGTSRNAATMMSLQPALVPEKNRVVITPPFWNENVGAGDCVAATPSTSLRLEKCEPGKASQTWQVVLAGDSGQFELHGLFGVISVADGEITTGHRGHAGLQTVPLTD